MAAAQKEHNYCLDFFKGVACVFVVFMHCEFPGKLGILVQSVSRFCVPFFFMVSGYFYFYNGEATKQEKINRTWHKIKHLGTIILAAVALYTAFAMCTRGGQLAVDRRQIAKFVLFNVPFIVAGQMWFLFALLYDYVLFGCIDLCGHQKAAHKLIPLMTLMYIILAQGAHLAGIKVANMYYRNFLIEGLCFFLLGNWMHYMQNRIHVDNRILIAVIVFTTLLCPVERLILRRDFGVNIVTFPQVAAIFLYGIQNPVKFKGSALCSFGTKYSMLIYVLHPAVWHTMEAIYSKAFLTENVVALYLMPILVLGLSVFCAIVFRDIMDSIKQKRYSND